MRSYSSLLAHIIGSHPQIVGHRERHCSYLHNSDLIRLRYHTYLETNRIPTGYFLDKILHNKYVLSDKIIRRSDVRFIALLRKPEPTFRSMIKLGRSGRDENYCDPFWILDYYESRLHNMEDYVLRAKAPIIFIDSEDIIQNTPTVMNTLKGWLDLKTELNSQYKIFPDTGMAGRGDSSDNIKAGKVLVGEHRDSQNVDVPSSILTQATKHYNRCRQFLRNRCKNI